MLPTTIRDSQLYRGNAPYSVRGVCSPNERTLALISTCGANSVRVYSLVGAGLSEFLAHALTLKVTVLVGLHVPKAHVWSDPTHVQSLIQTHLVTVTAFRDHPSVLGWCVGNELERTFSGPQETLWSGLNRVVSAVKACDPNHIVTTAVTTVGLATKIPLLVSRCPSIDVLSVNVYGSAPVLAASLTAAGWTRPYLVGELGPRGPWECDRTSWSAVIEPSDQTKAQQYALHYTTAVQVKQCIGSYVFLWGHKDEVTRTWFGLVLPDTCEPLATMDQMVKLWSRHLTTPQVRAPVILTCTITPVTADKEVIVRRGSRIRAQCTTNMVARCTWKLRLDSVSSIETLATAEGLDVWLTVPTTPGAYRVYVEARHRDGKAATMNVPILVT
jgi:hypothetical protein